MQKILNYLTTKGINVTVITIPPILKWGKYEGAIKAANESVKIVAANFPGIQNYTNKIRK